MRGVFLVSEQPAFCILHIWVEAPDRQKKRNSMIRVANVSVGFVEVETHVKMQGNGRSGLRAQRGIVIMVWVDGDACGLLHVFCKEHM